jgi:uncharacterized protein YndB with AHSA1/START domain
MAKSITVEALISAPVEKVWKIWNEPEHIVQWAFASDDWEAPYAENDVRDGGRFKTGMAAKDGSAKFDFTGTYTKVVPHESIEYTMDDGRKATLRFERVGDKTKIIETFEMEGTHSEDQQRTGWQAIMNNFKKHAESSK